MEHVVILSALLAQSLLVIAEDVSLEQLYKVIKLANVSMNFMHLIPKHKDVKCILAIRFAKPVISITKIYAYRAI